MAHKEVLLDAGLFIGALLRDDPRHAEALPLVEAARRGDLKACTTASILSEVYAALTWAGAQPPQNPVVAAKAVRLLVEPPSAIRVLTEGPEVALRMLELVAAHGLTARRVHDARHAAAALFNSVFCVYTYDVEDWKIFQCDGIEIAGPPSTLAMI